MATEKKQFILYGVVEQTFLSKIVIEAGGLEEARELVTNGAGSQVKVMPGGEHEFVKVYTEQEYVEENGFSPEDL